MGAVAEFETDLIIDRTTDGLASVLARGRLGGRPKGLTPAATQKVSIASALYKEGRLSVSESCGQVGISKPSLYNYLKVRIAVFLEIISREGLSLKPALYAICR